MLTTALITTISAGRNEQVPFRDEPSLPPSTWTAGVAETIRSTAVVGEVQETYEPDVGLKAEEIDPEEAAQEAADLAAIENAKTEEAKVHSSQHCDAVCCFSPPPLPALNSHLFSTDTDSVPWHRHTTLAA